jgi:hypothetical protein
MDYSPIVLKNKGVPTKFYKTKKVEGGLDLWEREYDDVGEPIIVESFVRFNNNIIADIEVHWGSLEDWQDKLEKQPVHTLRQTLAFATRRHNVDIGEAMLDGEVLGYSNVIGTAWAIANGVDPIMASRMLKQSAELAVEQKRMLNEAMSQQQEKTQDFLGSSGTQPGPKRAARTKSSGTSAQPK